MKTKAALLVLLVSFHTVKPLDVELLSKAFARCRVVATIEEHNRNAGLGGSVAEWLTEQGPLKARLIRIGMADEFLHEAGEQEHAREHYGLTVESMTQRSASACRSSQPAQGKLPMRFHHLGIVAPTVEEGKVALESLLGRLTWTSPVSDPMQEVQVLFARDRSGIRYELVVPLGESSPVSDNLRKCRNILNHVAYEVANLDQEQERLRKSGHVPLGAARPATAFAGERIVFLANPLGFIVELIENSSLGADGPTLKMESKE